MTERDVRVEEALRRVLPAGLGTRDWQDVLRRAERPVQSRGEGQPRRVASRRILLRLQRRRQILVALAALLALLIPVLAVGASQGWWFEQHNLKPWQQLPIPVNGAPAIVATGHTTNNQPWTAVVFIATGRPTPVEQATYKLAGQKAICDAVIIGSRSDVPKSLACGILYGTNGITRGRHGGWVTFLNFTLTSPALIVGAVAPGVARAEVILNPYPYFTGKPKTVDIKLTSSPFVDGGVHLFAFRYPAKVGIEHIVLYNKRGKIIWQSS